MKKLRVTVEGKAYEVLVEILDEGQAGVQAPVAAPVASASVQAPVSTPKPVKTASSGSGAVTSPLAGKLISVDVKQGQQVEEGQQVATIEAMKMNTYLYAPKAGSVASISANAGEPVEEGAVILTIA